ncbi:MAG: stage 0 sporulation family protein [Deltaproteobacteria bacterium]|nr:stage 0 sporulation family protein [Deltaproteobacteria bacterium]
MIRIVPLKFQQAGRQYDFNALSLELKAGDKVVVETDRGRAMATVVIPPREVEDSAAPEGLKPIQRIATEEDMALAETNSAREKEAYRFCVERIHSRQLEMKPVRAEYAFDGSKIIFFFTADGRIDFRELVKDLAHHFHTRIEMRQIGVRDEAKQVGGLGICGRELCCSTFLTQFSPVSVKMAKEQGLALNPSKISGQCGRLLCCLGYEFETYKELKKGMPKCGKRIMWQENELEVTSLDILRQQVTLRDRQGSCCCVTMEELRTGQANQPAPTEKSSEETLSNRLNKRKPQGHQSRRQQPSRSKTGKAGQGQDQSQSQSRADKTADEPTKPKEQQNRQTKKESPEGKSPSKRRRRGRRRPRSGPRPGSSDPGSNKPSSNKPASSKPASSKPASSKPDSNKQGE